MLMSLNTLTAIRGSVSSSAGDQLYETVEDRLRKSINTQRKIKETQIKMSEDHQKMRDLSINIRCVMAGLISDSNDYTDI